MDRSTTVILLTLPKLKAVKRARAVVDGEMFLTGRGADERLEVDIVRIAIGVFTAFFATPTLGPASPGDFCRRFG